MSAKWFIKHDGKELGPFSSSQLKTQAERGQVSPDTMVRRGDSKRWAPARKVKGLFAQKDTAPTSPEPEDEDVVAWIEQSSGPDQQAGIEPVEANRSVGLEAQEQYSLAPEESTPGPPRSCPSCGATLVVGLVVCSHCGFDPRAERMIASAKRSSSSSPSSVIANTLPQRRKPRSYWAFVGDVISEIWYMFTLRGENSTQLYGFLLVWYFLSTGICYLALSDVATMNQVSWTPTIGFHVTLFGGNLLGVFGACLGLVVESLLLGIALRIMRVDFPNASISADVVWDLYKWKTGCSLVIFGFALAIPPLGLLGALIIYLFLPASIYSQRFGISSGRALLVSLLIQVMPALFCCGVTVPLVVLST